MSKFLHVLFHILAIAAQYGNMVSGVVPVRFQPLVAALLSAAQAGVALSLHKSN